MSKHVQYFFQAPRLTSLQRQEDLRRMSKALQNLKKYTDSLIHGKSRCAGYSSAGQAPDNFKNLELCWDSWDQTAVNRVPPRNYHDPKHHRNNHIVSSTRRDESASPKQVSLDHICTGGILSNYGENVLTLFYFIDHIWRCSLILDILIINRYTKFITDFIGIFFSNEVEFIM